MEITVVEGDITSQEVDVLVNAANEQLAHGGGVAAAFVRSGGASIQEESDAWVAEHGPVPYGEAAVTGAGTLHARWIVHVVGPRYRGDGSDAGHLTVAVVAALDKSVELGAISVAMPAISAGIFGYPPEEATAVIVESVRHWADQHPGTVLDEVCLVGFSPEIAGAFHNAL
ncbi:MAG: macro domain-containing protein [Acidimicrobiia bacterium]|nr:macro domain-containing protein [Acidimicrobiia bacterium]